MSSAGQAIGGVVGAVAGFFAGGMTPTGALYGAQIGMMVGGYLDPPKGPTVNGPRLDDLSVQTSTYGAVIPRVYGTVAVNGNVFWLENNHLKETVTKKKTGGKGGGSKSTTRTYTYSATFAVGLCKGPIAGVRRIWVGPDLYYDAGSSDPGTIQASNDAAAGFRVYKGTDTQAADSRMQATLGVANTPAWRGLAYIVFYDLPLAKYGNSLAGAQVRVEVVTSGVYVDEGSSYTAPQSKWGVTIWDGARWVCTTDNTASATPRLCYSSDGINWTTQTGLDSVNSWRDLAFNGTTYLAIAGYGTGRFASSTDLINWTIVNAPGSNYYQQIIVNGSTFLCLSSDNYAVTTTNGTSWATGTCPNSVRRNTGCFNGSVYCFGSTLSGDIYTSSTGLSGWVTRSPGGGPWSKFDGVCAGPAGTMVAIGTLTSNGNQYALISTDDGVTWSAGYALPVYSGNIRFDIAWNGAYYIVVDFNGTHYCTSPDAQTWTTHNQPAGGVCGGRPAWNGSRWGIIRSNVNQASVFQLFRPDVLTGGQSVALSAIVSAESLQSGLLSAGDIDVTALASQQVRGYRIGSVGAIRAALEPLQAAWPFDVVQHGYQLRFVARGGASVVTIPAADLDARGAGQPPGVQATTSREMDSQLPRRVTVRHLDDGEYNPGTQYAERLNTAAINATVLDLPIVLTATEAAGKAEVLLYLYWMERYDVSIALPPTYNQLEPGDVVTLVTPEGNLSLRLTSIHYTSDGRLECQAKVANAATYTPTAIGVAPAVSGPTTIPPVGGSVYVLLDVPMINSAQAGPSFLAAMTGALTGWAGGALMQSTDAGSTWADLHDFGAPGCTMGTASNTIGAVDTGIMDNASLLTVTLTQGAIYSVTQLALFGGANYFAYGADGRWEIIGVQTATLVSGTSYVLQDLLRGRFGTEQYMSTHAAGDAIVLLDTTDLALIAMGSGTIGLSYLYRGITSGRDISTDSNRAFAYNAVNLKPLAPIFLTGNRDSSNDWALTWIRRTRDGGEWRDNVDAALGEAGESYQIDIYSDGTYTTVKRTIASTAPTVAYASADQNTDFGSNQATLYLKIYQISAAVGRGYPLTTSITR